MNPTAGKTESGDKVDQTSMALALTSCMDEFKLHILDKKALCRNSAKLKSQIHSQINDLIETLKERERQLFLEVDEHELDCSVLIADKFTDGAMDTNKSDIDDKDTKMCSAALQKKLFKFVGNFEPVKAQLQQFGKLEEVGETSNESSEIIQHNSLSPPKVKKINATINKLMRKFSSTKKMRKESSGSVESFEIIDGLDDDDYQKYFNLFKNEDDIEAVSNSDEFQPWQPSFPVGEIGFGNETESKQLDDLISPMQEASKDQQSAQSPDAKEVADPVTQINKQLQSLLCPKTDSKSKAQTSQLDGLSSQSFKMAPVPSAIIKNTFNKYLHQEDVGKWLVPSNSGLSNKNCGLDYLVSNPKGLHFKRS